MPGVPEPAKLMVVWLVLFSVLERLWMLSVAGEAEIKPADAGLIVIETEKSSSTLPVLFIVIFPICPEVLGGEVRSANDIGILSQERFVPTVTLRTRESRNAPSEYNVKLVQ